MSEQTMATIERGIEPLTRDSTDLLQLARLNTVNINGLSQQMGLMNDRMDSLMKRMDSHDNRLGVLEHNTTVNRAEAKRLQRAVVGRVTYLLGIEREGGRVADSDIPNDMCYRNQFISRCYYDAKTNSKMGLTYSETLKCDFNEVLEYIEAWEPEVDGGVEGYKHYLDLRREARERARAQCA